MSNVYSIYELSPVDNICDQVLREATRLPKVSIAHVIMDSGNVSLFHQHHKMWEFYYVLKGEGILYHGTRAMKVEKGAYLMLPPGVPHKLKSQSELEHLVLAMPPFDPNDVHITNELDEEPLIEDFEGYGEPFTARDGALVYGLFSDEEKQITEVGAAVGSLASFRKAILHKHDISDEVYYVISGKGQIQLGNSISPVRSGTVVYIPKGMDHGLENTGAEELEVFCLSSPPYVDEDFIIC